MRISDWSSDVCSSDLLADVDVQRHVPRRDRADDAGCFTQHVALVVVAVFILDAAILLPFHALEFGDQPVRTAQRAVDLRAVRGTGRGTGFVARKSTRLNSSH